MKDAIQNLIRIAAAADSSGDYRTADAVTEFLRVAQSLTVDKLLQGAPGANMMTNNLTDSATGYRGEYFRNNPRGVMDYQQGPENAMQLDAQNPYNWAGKSVDEIAQMNANEQNALAQSDNRIYEAIYAVRNWSNYFRAYPNIPQDLRVDMMSQIADGLAPLFTGLTQPMINQKWQLIKQNWPDMPRDIEAMVQQKIAQGQQMAAIQNQLTPGSANWDNSGWMNMPNTNAMGFQGAGMTPAPIK